MRRYDRLRVTYVFDRRRASRLAHFRARSDENNNLGIAIKNMNVWPMTPLVSGVHADPEPSDSPLRQCDNNPFSLGLQVERE